MIDVVEIPHELRQVVKKLIRNYEKAQKLQFVKNPIAYALYKTWREFDSRKENKNHENYRTEH